MRLAKLLSAFLLIAAACYDPVHADDVAALGDEAPGVPEGPLHRPGQHCTTCHGGSGPGSPEWSVAGTIYEQKNKPDPALGVSVVVTDARGKQVSLPTNEVGNFYIDKDAFDPVYPLTVKLQRGNDTREMTTNIGRDGGCGACHRGGGSNQYMPAIYFSEAK